MVEQFASEGITMDKFKQINIRDIVYIISFFITLGVLYGDVLENTEHRKDVVVHMPLQEKQKLFVTRIEYEQFKKDVIDRLFKKLDTIEERIDGMNR